MAQNFRNNHKDRTRQTKVRGEHISPKRPPKKRATHVDSSAKKKVSKDSLLSVDRENVPYWVFRKLNVTGWDELDKMFEMEYADAVRKNRPPFSGNVFVNFWYDDKMAIEDIKESLRVRWMANNCAPYGKLWEIVYDEMKRRYDPQVADRLGMPNGKRFKEDLCAAPHEDDELFLHTDKFKNAFENAVKIPLSNWRVMNRCGNKIERLEFMCRLLIDGKVETMVGCFERRIKKNQFVRHGGSSIGMYGYFRGDNTKRFTIRRQDYKPPYSHKNKLSNGQVKFRKHGGQKEMFALDMFDVPNTNASHEHNYTLSQRLFTNVRFPVDSEPTDKSKQQGREYIYETFDEMSAEFMKNKNLLMFNIPLFEIQKETVVKLAEKYCPVYDAAFNANFEAPKALKRGLDPVQDALIKVGKSPYAATSHLEKVFHLTEDANGKTYAKDKKSNIVKEFVASKKAKDNSTADYIKHLNEEGQKERNFEAKSPAIQNLHNTEKRHKKKKSNNKNNSHEFDDVSQKTKEIVGGMREFRRQKRKQNRGENAFGGNIDEEYYKDLGKSLGFDDREYDEIDVGENTHKEEQNHTRRMNDEMATDGVFDDLDDEVESEEENYEH